jgi:hypothetical protein
VKRAKNSPIGDVECPVKGCVRICQVYRFRPRTEGRTSVFSGKFYAECPDHGRIASDGNQATSRYIETNYKPAGDGPEQSATPAPAPRSAVRTPPAPPAKNSAPAPPAPVRSTPAPRPVEAPENPKPAPRPWWQPLID